ncbi:XRE family transcriptional regulator [Actinophytocola sp.]|uniref:nSTAND1 domain-containing NTPase n=1 Tax=Actinophytocola sp. TaxID=1872138 RepID=UPI003D6AC5DB
MLLRFAGELRRLRERAGRPTYRELATRAHYSAAALSEAAGGRKLPTLAVTLAYVTACGGDTAGWMARWRETAAELAGEAAEPEPHGGEAPYVGLAAFQPADAARFFGRDRLVDELVARVRATRFLGVFGPSGYGKSSVLRAGLIARLEPEPVVVLTPGAHPIEECAVRIAARLGESAAVLRSEFAADPANLHLRVRQAMAAADDDRPDDQPDAGDLVLVVDQFEEVFTLCADADERAWLIDALVTATRSANSRTRVVLGVRADFYGHCARHPELVTALRDSQILVGPLDEDELRDVIVKPAEQAGLRVETALAARLIAVTANEPGALPLLSHVLLETWRRRHGTTLTLGGYESAGGLRHALTRTAEDIVAGLDPARRLVAKQLFLRLCALGEGTDDAKRRVSREELADLPGAPELLDRLAAARLVTLDRDNVELAHEALIRHWPRLREWLTEDREGLRIHRQLTDAALAWKSLHRDAGALYRGARLARAQEWAAALPDGAEEALSPLEREFLHASRSALVAERTAERLRTRRQRRLVAVLVVLVVFASVTTVSAVLAQHDATEQRNAAAAQRVITQATLLVRTDPDLAEQLGLAAYRLAPTPENKDSLLRIAAATAERQVDQVGFEPGGRIWGVRIGETAVTINDVTDPDYSGDGQPLTTPTDTADGPTVDAMAFAPDGRTLAMVTLRKRVQAWDLTALPDRTPIASFTAPPGACDPSCSQLAIHPDGRTLAFASSQGGAWLWRVGDPTDALRPIPDSGVGLRGIAFSPDGRLLATAEESGRIVLWDVAEAATPEPLGSIRTGSVTYALNGSWIAFTRGTRLIATAGRENTAVIHDISDPRRPRHVVTLSGHAESVSSVSFSPDGRMLAAASADQTTALWDLRRPHAARLVGRLSADLEVPHRAAFGPDGHTVATAGKGQRLLLWETDFARLTATICARSVPMDRARWNRYFPGVEYREPCG